MILYPLNLAEDGPFSRCVVDCAYSSLLSIVHIVPPRWGAEGIFAEVTTCHQSQTALDEEEFPRVRH